MVALMPYTWLESEHAVENGDDVENAERPGDGSSDDVMGTALRRTTKTLPFNRAEEKF